MKNNLLITLLIALLLSACSNSPSNPGNSSKEMQATSKDDQTNVKDGPLTEVGQQMEEEDGTVVTLKKISKLDKTLDLDPIIMVLDEVKFLERSKDAQIENLIQISYSTENTSDKEVMFQGIKAVTTNTKHQIDVLTENLSLENGVGDYFGKVKKEGFVLLPYDNDSFEDIHQIKLITSDVWDYNKPDKYHDSLTIEIDIE